MVRRALLWVLASSACLSAGWCGEPVALDAPAQVRQVETELKEAIAKATPAFVFIGGGAGVCISADGYVLTNHHVVCRHGCWTVRVCGTGRMYLADVVGADPTGDVALLKIRNARDLPWLPFADVTKARAGQWVLALGDPYKLGDTDGPPSVSLGRLSALHRYQGDPQEPPATFYADALQTDAAVNPGSSGGPLVNLAGELLGLTGQIMSRFGGKANSGIAYAVPADQLARFVPLLKAAQGGAVQHGTLPAGMELEWETPPEGATPAGAVVRAVEAEGAAAQAGFQAGDRIVRVQGQESGGPYRLFGSVQGWPAGAELEFELWRGNALVKVRAVLGKLETGSNAVAAQGRKPTP